MCEFCDALTGGYKEKEILWNVRSTFADNNIEEIVGSDFTGDWFEDFSTFKIYGYEINGDIWVGLDYRQEYTNQTTKEKLIISPFSETLQFNFCPFCGKQISINIRQFDDYYKHVILIQEKEK